MYLRTLTEIFSDTSDMGTLRILAIAVLLISIVCFILKDLLSGTKSVMSKRPSLFGKPQKKRKKRTSSGNAEQPVDDQGIEAGIEDDSGGN